MTASASLIPELEEVIQHGSPERRVLTLQRITALFLDGANRFNEDHVRVFDDVFGCLIEEIEAKARAELSHRLAPVGNAPPQVVRTLAKDDDIAVAKPVLERSRRLAENDLVDIASTKSQAHLLAISTRPGIAEPVTDVLVKRGDRDVARSVAQNRTARLSDGSFSTLVNQAEKDGVLAEKVGLRPDIPPQMFKDLLLKATEVVQQRLLASANPETQVEIKRVLAKVSSEVGTKAAPRDYSNALCTVEALHKEGKLNEVQLVEFAKGGQYEETVASLALLCGVPIDVVDRLMSGDRPDPILILCKAVGWGWQTVRAIIVSRPDIRASSQGLDTAYSNFERLSTATAQRVMRFWQARTPEDRRQMSEVTGRSAPVNPRPQPAA
jgi:uncharacterized protein (DUF2336 family)